MEVLDRPASAVAEYQPFYAQLAELEKNNAALAFDYESKAGNKEARSHVFKMRQAKGALEAVRKNRAALAALVSGGLSEECAKQCVTLIASGKVPAISINY